MRKIGLHIDALAIIIILFLITFGFNFYQRYQYSDLLADYFRIRQLNTGMEFSLSLKEAQLKKCKETTGTEAPELNNSD